jgi:hypothetical protein
MNIEGLKKEKYVMNQMLKYEKKKTRKRKDQSIWKLEHGVILGVEKE